MELGKLSTSSGRSFTQRGDTIAYDKIWTLRWIREEIADDLMAVYQHTQARFLVMSFSSDWRFSPGAQRDRRRIDRRR